MDKALRRFRAKFQQVLHQAPSARKEDRRRRRTNDVDRALGFDTGAHSHTDGCIAYSTFHQPSTSGSRPQSSNVEVKGETAVKRFLHWLAGVALLRVSKKKQNCTSTQGTCKHASPEPCTRGALKGAHKALVFMEGSRRSHSTIKSHHHRPVF